MLNIYPWQQSILENISKQWQQNTMPHALLLEGPKGIGKFDFTKALAAKLLCQADIGLRTTGLACGICRRCHLLKTFHPDLIILEPEEKSTVIKIDAVRTMIEKIQQTSTCGGHQVVIIHPAEAMNINCANALLKTLEEPPENVIFMLVSHQAAKLPATVLSRCQRLNFGTPSIDASILWLKEQSEKQDFEAVLRISEYAPLRALELLNLQFLNLRDELIQDLHNILQNEESPITKALNWQKQDSELFFLALFTILMDVWCLLLTVDQKFLVNQDRVDEIKGLSRCFNKAQVDAHLREVQRARELMLGHHNPNAQLLIERLFLNMAGKAYVN